MEGQIDVELINSVEKLPVTQEFSPNFTEPEGLFLYLPLVPILGQLHRFLKHWTYGIQLWGTASTSNVEIL
jgi:hypothetical protein